MPLQGLQIQVEIPRVMSLWIYPLIFSKGTYIENDLSKGPAIHQQTIHYLKEESTEATAHACGLFLSMEKKTISKKDSLYSCLYVMLQLDFLLSSSQI